MSHQVKKDYKLLKEFTINPKIPYSAPSALLGPLDIVPGLPAPEARLQPGGRVVHHPGVQLAQV